MAEISGKYRIEKSDGTPVDSDAVYFVLRIDTDPHARKALLTYAESVGGLLRTQLEMLARRHMTALEQRQEGE